MVAKSCTALGHQKGLLPVQPLCRLCVTFGAREVRAPFRYRCPFGDGCCDPVACF